ncbi:MAG: hypothetical protein OXI33_05415, partial [Chloroflexota bacterium]|nr:hypothetical protein [Chloroflexota bacterium]
HRGCCRVAVGTDNSAHRNAAAWGDFQRYEPENMEHQLPGINTFLAIKGLVELGMTRSEAIPAATKKWRRREARRSTNTARSKRGRRQTSVVLDANPLADIEPPPSRPHRPRSGRRNTRCSHGRYPSTPNFRRTPVPCILFVIQPATR